MFSIYTLYVLNQCTLVCMYHMFHIMVGGILADLFNNEMRVSFSLHIENTVILNVTAIYFILSMYSVYSMYFMYSVYTMHSMYSLLCILLYVYSQMLLH